jgi:myosin heavy subunit
MTNVYTLKDINNKGHRLGSAYEQELEKKLYTTLSSKAEINDLCEKLLAKNSEYSEREEEFQRIYADMGNKASQLNASSTELRSKFISERRSRIELEAEVKSLKSNIKTLKRELTLAQKASSVDKVQILSLETKIRELEGKLEDIDLERTYHDLDVMGGVIEEPVQISSSDPKEIDSLRLELEQVKEDRNSKEYTIECMEKGIESSNSIFRREIDALYSARSKLREENRSFRDQLELKENNEIPSPPPPMNDSSQIISVGGAETVSLPSAIPIVASSLMSPLIIYSILIFLLIAIMYFVFGKKIWNS